MKNKEKIVVLSGAGVSAESGIKTFRDHDGLWEGHDVMEVATFEGWLSDPELVLDFYNQRRRNVIEVEPNKAHYRLAELEANYDVHIITQNVDDLHERAGSTNVLHLHGEMLKVRSVEDEALVLDWKDDLKLGDLGPDGQQLRPHIVWFGESVPMIEQAAKIVSGADYLIVIGTSLVVYPAAGLIDYAHPDIPKFIIDPRKPDVIEHPSLNFIEEKATTGMDILIEEHLNLSV